MSQPASAGQPPTGCAGVSVSSPADPAAGIAPRLIAWQRRSGRHGLPWQATREPYHVWLSEIMLQQTRVATVLDYYPRFLQQFPSLASLAAAPLEAVLALWSGLGYYSRARNLHQCAQHVQNHLGGQFPRSAAQLQTLPGIGPSTAAAIAAFCFGERAAIFDGNVQRVLARHLADGSDLARASHTRALHQRARALLPAASADMPAYTQALMDLGATICTPRQPRCTACPIASDCQARQQGCPENYPVKTRKLKRSRQTLWLLLPHTPDGACWLHPRPARGIWAGLHALPAFDSRQALEQALQAALPAPRPALHWLPPLTHALTHKDLTLHTARLPLPAATALTLPEHPGGQWHPHPHWPHLGLPAPIRRQLLEATQNLPEKQANRPQRP